MVNSLSSHCPDIPELIAYSLGKLDFAQINNVSDHLSTCASCSTKLASFDHESDELINSLWTPPLSIGQISLEYEIGSGGMGRVFKGRDTRLNRPVAVKIINTEKLKEWKDLAERFEREVQTLAKVESPHVVKALFAGEENDFTFFVQEYVDGKNLKEWLQQLQSPMQAKACVSILHQVASGLTAVHELGIVHRDIHPGNILLNSTGYVQIADFGLAFEPEGRSDKNDLTSIRQGFGQLNFVSPEQWIAAHNATAKSDIYSLGCVWYYLLTGHTLNRDPETLEVINPSSQLQMLGRSDRKLLKTMLNSAPQQRPTAQEVAAALQSRLGAPDSIENTLKKQSKPDTLKFKRYGILASPFLLVLFFMIYLAFQPFDSNFSELASLPAPAASLPGHTSASITSNEEQFALRFDGVNDFVETSFVYENGEPVTFEVWLTPNCIDRSRTMEIVSNAETAGIILRLKEGTRPEFLFHEGTGYAAHTRSQHIVCEKLVHLAAVYDGISIGIFVNGKKQGLNFPVRRRHRLSPIPIHLGANPDPALTGRSVSEKRNCFAGLLHQCRFSKGAIYQDDFSPEKMLSANDSTIVLYHLNTDTGKTVHDKSGNGYDGKIVGATWEKFDPLEVPEQNDQYKWPSEMPDPVLANDSPDRIRELQLAWGDYLKLPMQLKVPVGENTKIELVLIPPGEFMMGTMNDALQNLNYSEIQKEAKPRSLTADLPQHLTRITYPFYLSKTEVSRKQFRQFVDQTNYRTDAEIDELGGSNFKLSEMNPRITWAGNFEGALSDDHPVVNLTWYDATNYCGWLTRNHPQFVFDLPSESQWEYACRSGTTSNWYTSDENQLPKYCWFLSTNTYRCGKLLPNAFGLYDMHGNVSEWCRDYFSTKDSFSNPVNNPSGPHSGTHRVTRGGSASNDARSCRSAFREGRLSQSRDAMTGFRIFATINTIAENLDSLDKFSLYFDGEDDNAEAMFKFRKSSGPLTIECWAEIPEVTLNDQFASSVIFDLHSHLRALYCVLRNQRVHMYYRQGDWVWHAFSAKIPPGNHHVAGVFDGTTLNAFVDGVAPEKVSKNRADREARYLRSRLQIGSGSTIENSQHHGFRGRISQVRVSEQAVYNAKFTPNKLLTKRASTVGLYRFEEGIGNVLQDLSGMHNQVRITGAKWTVRLPHASRIVKQGLRFDGNDWIEVKLPDESVQKLTIEAWLSPQSTKKLAHFLVFRLGNSSLKYHVNNGEYWTWSLLDSQSQEVPISSSSSRNVAIDRPVHIACQWDGTRWKMFLNGLPCPTKFMRGIQKEQLVDMISECLEQNLFIGGVPTSRKVPSQAFEGIIHVVRVSKVERYSKLFTPRNDFDIDEDTLLLYRFDEKTGNTARDSSEHKLHGAIHGAEWLAE